jgi:hypothetical protein
VIYTPFLDKKLVDKSSERDIRVFPGREHHTPQGEKTGCNHHRPHRTTIEKYIHESETDGAKPSRKRVRDNILQQSE